MKSEMGIIKVEIKIPELRRALEAFKTNRISALEMSVTEIKDSAAGTFSQLLNAEMTLFLGSARARRK
jgi:hypothetical protein